MAVDNESTALVKILKLTGLAQNFKLAQQF
jgi:hypothetical protein